MGPWKVVPASFSKLRLLAARLEDDHATIGVRKWRY
jgi:hypothetical protein